MHTHFLHKKDLRLHGSVPRQPDSVHVSLPILLLDLNFPGFPWWLGGLRTHCSNSGLTPSPAQWVKGPGVAAAADSIP